MLEKKTVPGLILGLLLLLSPLAASAENSRDFGDYVVHINALTTDLLPPAVAKQYSIVRSSQRAMLNVTVLRKVLDMPGEPVPATIKATANNLAGQHKTLELREIREGHAIYYISEFPVSNEEIINFKLKLKPEGQYSSFDMEYRQQFYTH